MRVALIADGDSILGLGHVYQTIALTHYLRRTLGNSADLVILTSSDSSVVQLLASSGYPVYKCSGDDNLARRLKEICPDRVVIDNVHVSSALARTISEVLGIKLIILTNLSDANRYADVMVMAGMGSSFKNIRRHVGGQLQLWGPRYWIIRPEFRQPTEKADDPLKVITLIFGGADPANLSAVALTELLQLKQDFSINLILGAAFAHHATLKLVLDDYAELANSVNVIENTGSVAQTMRGSDLVLASPGLSFFEALMVGTPVLCFHQNAFQEDAWRDTIKTFSKADIGKIGELIKRRQFIFPDDPSVIAMEIGQGIEEIVAEIIS